MDAGRAFPDRRSCCPAGPMRSSTCRPTRAPLSSAPSGATATPTSRRSTSSRWDPRQTRSGPVTSRIGRTTSCRTPSASISTTPAGARSHRGRRRTGFRPARCASTGTGCRSPSRPGSATSTRPARRWSSTSRSTTTPRCGWTAGCRWRSATAAARSSAASTLPTAWSSRGTPGRGRHSRSRSSASTDRSRRRRSTTSGCGVTLDFFTADRAVAERAGHPRRRTRGQRP